MLPQFLSDPIWYETHENKYIFIPHTYNQTNPSLPKLMSAYRSVLCMHGTCSRVEQWLLCVIVFNLCSGWSFVFQKLFVYCDLLCSHLLFFAWSLCTPGVYWSPFVPFNMTLYAYIILYILSCHSKEVQSYWLESGKPCRKTSQFGDEVAAVWLKFGLLNIHSEALSLLTLTLSQPLHTWTGWISFCRWTKCPRKRLSRGTEYPWEQGIPVAEESLHPWKATVQDLCRAKKPADKPLWPPTASHCGEVSFWPPKPSYWRNHFEICGGAAAPVYPLPRPKHPVKVHIWAGISPRGATQVVIFSGIMTSTRYCSILEAGLIPFLKEVFLQGHQFQQDNDPKHCSHYTTNFLLEKNIKWWKTSWKPRLEPDRKCVGIS